MWRLWICLMLLASPAFAQNSATDVQTRDSVKQETPSCCAEGDKKSPLSLDIFAQGPWHEPATRNKKFTMPYQVVTQDENKFQMDALFDKPTALTFLYTRCENPNKCPLVAKTMTKLQQEVEKAGLSGQVNLCILSYDPEYDSPAILKKYAELIGFKCSGQAMMLCPGKEDKIEIFKALGATVNFNGNRVNIHGLQLLLIDKKGRLAREYHTLIWDNTAVLNDLRKLTAE